jgi:uncharacterized cupredoxin-like copper-binding protein
MNCSAGAIAPRRWGLAIASCVATLVILSGCGASASAGTGAGGAMVGVTEHDFHISTTVVHVSPGEVTFRIHNNGPDEHELIIAPDRKGGLPLRRDGITVNEEAIQSSEPGSITPQQPGGTESLQVHLAAGRYVLFCNMEGHYLGGMHTVLDVG